VINAGYLEIQIDQGATFLLPFQVVDESDVAVSLTGATIRGQIRATPQSATVIETFTGTVTSAGDGEGQVSLSAAETAAIPVDASEAGQRAITTYVYDVEIVYADTTVQRILEGPCFISPEATRS
jgi:hypothetical protein